MDLLMVVLFIGISILSSANKSKQAKRQREERLRGPQNPSETMTRTQMQTPGRTTASQRANAGKAAQQKAQKPAPRPATAAKPAASAKPTSKQKTATSKKNQQSFDWRELFRQTEAKPEPKKPMTQSASQTRKTLIEQKPDCEAHHVDREEREHSNHERVSASVKPISASVKPLRSVYENDEACEHRIELNPNIQYQHQQGAEQQARTIPVKTDSDSLMQGIIWSEILGKPKAYRGRGPVRR